MKKNLINNIKLIIVVLMAVAIAFSALAPIFALENEIREEISSLMEEVQGIVKDFAEVPEVITTKNNVLGVPAGFVFRNELRERVSGDAVRYLQSVLNADPDTRIATSGAGALGRETNYFGPSTRRAIIAFQRKHGLSVTGIFDSTTRTKANEVIQKGVEIKQKPTEEINMIRLRLVQAMQRMKRIRELRSREADLKEIVSCLEREDVVIYGSLSCPACNQLADSFGGYDLISSIYVECAEERDRCVEEKLTEYVPEIQIKGELYEGGISPEILAASACRQ